MIYYYFSVSYAGRERNNHGIKTYTGRKSLHRENGQAVHSLFFHLLSSGGGLSADRPVPVVHRIYRYTSRYDYISWYRYCNLRRDVLGSDIRQQQT